MHCVLQLSADPKTGKENDGGVAEWLKMLQDGTVGMVRLWNELQVKPVIDSICWKVRDSFIKPCKQYEDRDKMTLLLQLCNAELCERGKK